MLPLISQGASLGFSAGAIPGPLHTYMVNETLLHGLRRSVIVALTPIISDIPLIILMVLILNQMPDTILTTLKLVGGVYIWYLAYQTWQQAQQVAITTLDAPPNARFMLGRAVLINWLNPAPYIFWSTVNGPILVDALNESVLHGVAFLAAFYGMLCGMVFMVGVLFNRLRGRESTLTQRLLWISTALLTILGAILITDGLRDLI